MEFRLDHMMDILRRTPSVLTELLRDIPEEWAMSNEGPDTFSPFDVVGHLIHGERTDWVARMDIILSDARDKTFAPYDRFAQYQESAGKSMDELLEIFSALRANNLHYVREKDLNAQDLLKTGIHPKFGTVTLQQLLSTWTAHDLSHIAQITRVMCKQYRSEVGPWVEYMRIFTL